MTGSANRKGTSGENDLAALEVTVSTGDAPLPGLLTQPSEPAGAVVFVHGSGSSRLSPRNQLVASALNRAGFVTLLFDLLTPQEEFDRTNVFDIALLSQRLIDATTWLRPQLANELPTGFFGASTGAAAALVAAAHFQEEIPAVVSRGGRPDLAGAALPKVRAATLLIVGGRDTVVLELNRDAMTQMTSEVDLSIVDGATHLFEEPGALEDVATLASDWFTNHLAWE